MERSSREFAADRITVLWEGKGEGVGFRDSFLDKRAIIEAQGWEIIDIRVAPLKKPTILFTMRRALNASCSS